MVTLSMKKSTAIGVSYLNSKVSMYLTLLECPENLRDDGKDSPTGSEHFTIYNNLHLPRVVQNLSETLKALKLSQMYDYCQLCTKCQSFESHSQLQWHCTDTLFGLIS